MLGIAPALQASRAQAISQSYYIPPPVGGLNSRDSEADMPEEDALELTNFFPQPDYVEIRRGHASHATGVGAAIESLMEWAGPSSAKLFAADSNEIYNVTSSGAVGSADLTGLLNARWQHVMQATSAGNFLLCVNGADTLRAYNGTSWSIPTISGVSSATIDNIAVFKKRVWMVQENTTDAWYLPTETIAGAATKYPIGSYFNKGGKLLVITAFTRDGGDGPDDLLACISDRGQAAIFQGVDPDFINTWGYVGTFDIPPPIGKRCVQKSGGDIAVLTEGGVISLSAMLVLDRAAQEKAAVTDKINRLFMNTARTYRSVFGWQMLSYPRSNYFMVNVPKRAAAEQFQFVMNALTGAWCKFTGLDGGCWATFNEDLYFGGNSGTVWKADTGFQDNGGGYTADLKTAFNFIGGRTRIKDAKMMRSLYRSNGLPGVGMRLNVDFADAPVLNTPAATQQASSVWGTATWGDQWVGGEASYRRWRGASGIGTSYAARLRVVTNGASFTGNGFDIIAESGGMM